MRNRSPISPGQPVSGLIGGIVSYTPTVILAAGTLTLGQAWYQKLGQMLNIWASFTGGSATTGAFSMTLPNGFTPLSIGQMCGRFAHANDTTQTDLIVNATQLASAANPTIAIGPTYYAWAQVPLLG